MQILIQILWFHYSWLHLFKIDSNQTKTAGRWPTPSLSKLNCYAHLYRRVSYYVTANQSGPSVGTTVNNLHQSLCSLSLSGRLGYNTCSYLVLSEELNICIFQFCSFINPLLHRNVQFTSLSFHFWVGLPTWRKSTRAFKNCGHTAHH